MRLFYLPTYYLSIEDLPIYNWFKIHETNDRSYLIKEGNKRWATDKALNDAWGRVFSEFIDTFGISDSFREILSLKRDIMQHRLRLEYSGDGTNKTFIKIKELHLSELLQEEGGEKKVNEVKVYIEKFVGFRIDEKTTSVKEYYTYLKVFADSNTGNVSAPDNEEED